MRELWEMMWRHVREHCREIRESGEVQDARVSHGAWENGHPTVVYIIAPLHSLKLINVTIKLEPAGKK